MTDDRGHDWMNGTCLRCGLSQRSGAADLDLPCAVTANDRTDPWTVSGDSLALYASPCCGVESTIVDAHPTYNTMRCGQCGKTWNA